MTDNQLEANRANAQLSTGPRTEAGKRRSSLNARRHSLTGKIHIASPEEADAFDKHCQSYREALLPIGFQEHELAQDIAEDRWRIKRARSLENSIFAECHLHYSDMAPYGEPQVDGALSEAKTWLEQSRQLQLLTLYEGRIRRAIEKNTDELKAMQAERKAAYAQAQHDAILLVRVATSEGETYLPLADFAPPESHGGFVFSLPDLVRVVNREYRLNRARHLANSQPFAPLM
jgi:hypothetical protein